MPAISVNHLTKNFILKHERHKTLKQSLLSRFKNNREILTVLDDISFEVKEGEFFGIIGRNGCGKSTLLKILANIYEPTKGEVKIKGKVSPFLELGVGFQPELTAYENIFLYGAMLGMSEKKLNKKVAEIIAFAELEKFVDTKVKNFSSGMYVRLAFSIAIQAEFDILLLDEVLAVGDAHFQEKCFSKFRQFKSIDKTVVFVSHAQASVEEYCDQALLLENGKKMEIGQPGKVFASYNLLLNQSISQASVINETKKEISTIKESSNRWGNGQLRIEEMIFDKPDKIFQSLDIVSGKIIIKINDNSIKDKLSEIDFSLGFYNHKDVLILLDQLILKNTNDDIITLPFNIKLPDLAEGYYRFSVDLSHYQKQKNGIVYDHWDKDNAILVKNNLAKQAGIMNTYSFFVNHIKIIGLVLIRNEELILQDTLDSFSQIVDGIIVYDDASEDNSVIIARRHPKVLAVIENKTWKKNRQEEETLNRQISLEKARTYKPEWIFYSDADERFEGKIREFLLSDESKKIDGVKIQLFDAYMTPKDQKPYTHGLLYNFRKMFGPEKRNILMIWRDKPDVKFEGIIQREPVIGNGNIVTKFYCQHYGKSISIKQWEETCDFYANNFPEPYLSKWKNRKGKAIHDGQSDFGGKLYLWGKELFDNSLDLKNLEEKSQ